MTGGVLMSKNNLLLGFILGLMGTFFLLSAGKAQDRIPACPPLGKTLKMIKPLRGNELGRMIPSPCRLLFLPLSAKPEGMR